MAQGGMLILMSNRTTSCSSVASKIHRKQQSTSRIYGFTTPSVSYGTMFPCLRLRKSQIHGPRFRFYLMKPERSYTADTLESRRQSESVSRTRAEVKLFVRY